ncbi:hypothetical protein BDZ94DRAFT_1314991 [Collybia nuda]|uniref:RING-type domain-containing protein n=1 Tax=Collybia nuda TaxID=64659 RepID=A0A9P5XTS7_9AGAR|nr:hypothetical protein BDZ94DRAFT_1314991 [Collybia nuda]
MPVCLHCNRKFSNKEALHQHIKSSSVEHPYCAPCDRRFISQAACDAHMTAKHPATFDCGLCNRSFPALFALEDHYRGSISHPNCPKCGRGFKDNAERDEHHQNAHPRVPCHPCDGMMVYEEALEDHYLQSSNHPSCRGCNRGFKDDSMHAEHVGLVHPELRCDPCERRFETAEALQNHYFASANHPECTMCNRGFKNDVEHRAHMQTHRAITKIEPDASLGSSGSVHGFSPLSPRTFQDLIVGDAMKDAISSPALSLPMNFASPLMDVQTPNFSPIALPRPGRIVEEVWAARDNVQTSFSRAPQKPSNLSKSTRATPFLMRSQMGDFDSARVQDQSLIEEYSPRRMSDPPPQTDKSIGPHFTSPSDDFKTMWHGNDGRMHEEFVPSWRSRNLRPPLGGTQFSDAQAARQFSTSMKYGLYAGSAASRLTSNNLQPPTRFLRTNDKIPLDSSLAPLQVNWQEILGEKKVVQRDPESSLSDDISTQAVDTPIHSFAALETGSNPFGHESLSSNSSLPGGSFSPWSPQPPEIIVSPTNTQSDDPGRSALPYSNMSISEHSQSPEVFSPVGLAPLPMVSPLASSPIEFPFSNSRPSPNPRVTDLSDASPKSTLHLALDTKLPESPSMSSITSSQQSSANSPQDLEWDDQIHEEILSVKLPDSPMSDSHTSSSFTTPSMSYRTLEEDTSGGTEKLFRHLSPSGKDADTEETLINEDQSSYNSKQPLLSPNISTSQDAPIQHMHCRLCQSNPCEDLTATMCGHIFCYRCITDEIIKTSRCPSCATPTLLYCLFRLDLSV